jgi:Tol biopolymer transport system component
MNLATGTRLGPYEVLSALGAGGMGEVYRARDTRLGREVAVKVLPAAFSENAERLARFEQEASAAGALNHPNILAIYDVGTDGGGAPYVVSELLEGETLREKMGGGALPQRKAIDYALQIAYGLAAAHAKGIVHRDLKPENLFVTKDGRVKILDFGLAKLTAAGDGVGAQSEAPTRRVNTDPGAVMGTVGYMSPEQVRGQAVDHRSDIFSFGAILYEMLTGRCAFLGGSAADTLSAILKEEPPALSESNKNIAPALERVVRHCLEKNPEERFQSASDLAFALETRWVAESGSETAARARVAAGGRNRERLAWMAATAILLLALIVALPFAIAYLRQTPVDKRAVRLSIPTPNLTGIVDDFALSPDGGRLAFSATDSSGKERLWLRQLDSLTLRPLPETDGAFSPFWSPDSRFIGFFAGTKLKKIDVSGGAPQILCDAQIGGGGTWNRDGVIVFAPGGGRPLYRVSAAGGESAPLTKLDESRERSHWWPQFLPDGRHFLYLSRQEKSGIYVGSLDSNETRRILESDFNVAYAPPGYLLFARESALMAQPFDAGKLELTGEPFLVAEQVGRYTYGRSPFTVSENAVVYERGELGNSQLAWHDRAGKQISTVGPPGSYYSMWLSPDEKGVAVERAEGASTDIWLIDIARNTPTRFTFDPAIHRNPIWSPDGSRIAFASNRTGVPDLYVKSASGSSNEELLLETSSVKFPTDWSLDGKLILYEERSGKGKNDIWLLPLEGDRTPKPFLQDDFYKRGAKFSPDGKWIAYSSDESGQDQVYVKSFPGPGAKYQVSTGGGRQPRWRRDGKEIFYISADGKLMAVEVKAGLTFEALAAKPLFDTPIKVYVWVAPLSKDSYAVSGDGQRFLINNFTETSAPLFTVVMNWTADLKKN